MLAATYLRINCEARSLRGWPHCASSLFCASPRSLPFGHSARPAANDSIRHSSSSSFGLCSHLHTNRLSGTLPSTLGELLDLEDLYATRCLCIAAGGGG